MSKSVLLTDEEIMLLESWCMAKATVGRFTLTGEESFVFGTKADYKAYSFGDGKEDHINRFLRCYQVTYAAGKLRVIESDTLLTLFFNVKLDKKSRASSSGQILGSVGRCEVAK